MMSNKNKKNFVLFILFILPLLLYVFLQFSTNNFAKLPVVTKNVTDIKKFDSTIQLQDKISVVVFLGKNNPRAKGSIFNLNQKIYKHFYGFNDFQFVIISPKNEQSTIQEDLKKELGKFTDLSKYRFASIEEKSIHELFQNLQTNESLDDNLYCPKAFIIDKDLNLRGRLKNNKKDKKLFGYNMESVGELNDKMKDDVKIVLAEYRLALKKNDKRKI